MTNNFDINEIRRQFPILDRTVYGKPLVYFDNAATTQKPLCVIERERDYYLNENCNIHRGVHYLSQEATEAYENARKTVASFLNAKDSPKLLQIYKNYPIYHAFLEIKHTFLTKNNFVRDFFSNFAGCFI